MEKEFELWLKEKRNVLEILQTNEECKSIYDCIINSNNLEGDLVEIGVYNCGSASILSEFKNKSKILYLFDTFAGLVDCNPYKDTLSNGTIIPTMNLDSVNELFKDNNVIVTAGYFPDSAPEHFDLKKFSLIHIDVDTYQSTLNSLNYFYDKIIKGGFIIVHDYKNQYGHTDGVKIAVDELLNNKNEDIFNVVDSQCIILKK